MIKVVGHYWSKQPFRGETNKCSTCFGSNDIPNVISYLLMNLRGSAFVEQEGDKVPLIGVYHAKSWDAQKSRTEKDFKGNGTQPVVVATCALGMGVNFLNVQYVIHYGLLTGLFL